MEYRFQGISALNLTQFHCFLLSNSQTPTLMPLSQLVPLSELSVLVTAFSLFLTMSLKLNPSVMISSKPVTQSSFFSNTLISYQKLHLE